MTRKQRRENHRNPVPAVDLIISKDHNSKIVLVRRKNDPFKGMLSIPGGFINERETAEDAMKREAKEEISLILEPTAILGVYSDPSRDPRMHTISVTFITRTVRGNEAPNDDAVALQWINVEDELDRLIQSNQIAFDHSRILTDFTNWRNATQRSDEENNKIPTFWSTKKKEVGTEANFRGKPSD